MAYKTAENNMKKLPSRSTIKQLHIGFCMSQVRAEVDHLLRFILRSCRSTYQDLS